MSDAGGNHYLPPGLWRVRLSITNNRLVLVKKARPLQMSEDQHLQKKCGGEDHIPWVISPTWELFFATLRPGGHIRGHVIFYLHGVEFQESASRALLSVLVCVADCTLFHASLSTRPSEVFERHLLSPSTDTLKKRSVILPPPSWKGPERGDKTTKLLCGQLRQ